MTTVGGTAGGIGGTGPAATTGRGWPWGSGTSPPPSTGCQRTTALSTSTRSRCRTASGRRPTENTAGSTKGTSTAISTGVTTIRERRITGNWVLVSYVKTIFTGK